jgi:hypothetical protein
MKASRADRVRFTLILLMALILIGTQILGNQNAQARDARVISHPAPGESTILTRLAPQDTATVAELMAAEMAALTPPQYITDIPIVIH